MKTDGEISNFLDSMQFDSHIRSLFELIPDLHFFIKDFDGRLIFCNATHQHSIFRYKDAENAFGNNNFDLLASAFADDDRQVMDSGEPLRDRFELNMTHSGALCWFCTTKLPARNSDGDIIGLIGISRRLAPSDQRLNKYDILLPAIDYIQDYKTERILIKDLAQICKMTEVTFRREFKKMFQMTPIRFINRVRIHEACSKLSSGPDSVGEVSWQCGFEDQNYFTRQFKLITGTTPTEFRRQNPHRAT
jgi:AraC-like DNA-binding protein